MGLRGSAAMPAASPLVVPETLLVFPEDFGAHPSFRIEWWYLTANLKDASGASYGAQWTLFRQAMEPGLERKGWRTRTFGWGTLP